MAQRKNSIAIIISVVLLLGFIGEAVFLYDKIIEVRDTCAAMKAKEAETLARLREMEKIAEYNRSYIDEMLRNPEFMQMEVRARLGVAVPGEVVLREDASPRKSSDKKERGARER